MWALQTVETLPSIALAAVFMDLCVCAHLCVHERRLPFKVWALWMLTGEADYWENVEGLAFILIIRG